MSGDWIKMQVTLPDKPEVWQMAGMLSIDADSVVGKLVRVWVWFDSHTEDGNAVGVSFPLIDRVAGVAGFAEAMSMVGWLEQNGHVLTLPKFGRHNGKTAKNRALTNERVAKHRKPATAKVTPEALQEALPKPLPEKRREEELTHTALRADWSPSKEEIDSAIVENPHWTAETVAAAARRFTDHFRASGGTSADWGASWRKWCCDPLTKAAHKAAPTSRDAKPAVKDWTESAPGIIAKGVELGLGEPDPLEQFPAYKARVFREAGVTTQ